jgi:serine/threonine-protein kinase HipA
LCEFIVQVWLGAQVFGLFPDDNYGYKSYANIASVLWAEARQEDTYEFVRRLVLSVLIGNADMHLVVALSRQALARSLSSVRFCRDAAASSKRYTCSEFGGSRGLEGITRDQMRCFADTARIPASPLWGIATETAERTIVNWKTLPQADLLPKKLRAAIDKQIRHIARSVSR